MVDLVQLRTLASLLAPFLLPQIISRVRLFQQTGSFTGNGSPRQIVPLSTKYKILIVIILTAAVAHLFHAAVYLTDDPNNLLNSNVYAVSGLPIYAPIETIARTLNRLGRMTEYREHLLRHLTSTKARAIFAAFGPRALTECTWCVPENDDSYRIFVAPTLIWPFIAQVVLVGAVTAVSPRLRSLRIGATTLLVIGLGFDIWALISFDPVANVKARGPKQTRWLFHELQRQRDGMLAAFDIFFSVAVYLVGTRRLSFSGGEVPELVEQSREIMREFQALEQRLDAVLQKNRSSSVVRGLVNTDETLQKQDAQFWAEIRQGEDKLFSEERVKAALADARSSEEYAKIVEESVAYSDAIIFAGKRNLGV